MPPRILALLLGLFLSAPIVSAEELRMSMSDVFQVQDTPEWTVKVSKKLTLRFAEVNIVPKKGSSFSMRLMFLCDTPDLAKWDTDEKRRLGVERAMARPAAESVEGKVLIEEFLVKARKAYRATITDKSLVGKQPAPGQYRYLTQGAMRLSEDSALMFSLLTNDKDSEETRALQRYIESFAKAE